MNSDSRTNNDPGGDSGIVWAFKFLIRLTLTAILVLALASLLWFGWQQLDRWMDKMNRRTVLLETDTGYLLDQMATSEAQISELTTRLASGVEGAADLDSSIDRQVEAQETALFRIEAVASSGLIISETVSVLGEGVSALQGDVNENLSQIDQIGGRADAALIRAATLETQLATLEAAASEPGEEVILLTEALRWFHLRELVSRGRLRLAENNPGLAAADIEQTYLTAVSFQAENPEEDDEALSTVVDRLDLAFTSLPDDPAAAARDLESVWVAIDQILVKILGIERIETGLELLVTPTGTGEPEDLAGDNSAAEDNSEADEAGVDSTGTSEAEVTQTPVSGTPEATPTPSE